MPVRQHASSGYHPFFDTSKPCNCSIHCAAANWEMEQERLQENRQGRQFSSCMGEPTVLEPPITPPAPANSWQQGVRHSLLYNGSKFGGCQKSKGNSYEVEVVLQVNISKDYLVTLLLTLFCNVRSTWMKPIATSVVIS